MKNKYFLCVVGLGCLSGAVLALEMQPYVGLDAQARFMPFAEGYGRNLVKKKYPQANIYAGIQLGNVFGLEMGYERAKNNTSITLVPQNSFFGNIVPPGVTMGPFTVNSRISGAHASLTSTFTLSQTYRLDLIGSAGVAYLREKTMLITGNPNADRIFAEKKWIPRASVGLQKILTQHIGLRTTLTWEKTSNFNRMAPVNATSNLRASMKNSTIFGLGAFYRF